MEKVVGVRFRNVGKIYYFNPKNYNVKVGDHVIVETARGVEYGRVVLEPRSVKEDEVVHPLKEVLRVATKEDEDHEAENRQKEKEAFKICKKKIREHGLDMKLIDAEYTFDNNKVLFYFTADGRIDFRELVKDFIKTHQKEILNVIYKDTTENNPIALITRNRTSSIFLYELVENIDWSKENIEKQPGLKMLTTSLKTITPSAYHHPSDFVVLLTEKLNKYEHLKDFTNKLVNELVNENHTIINSDISIAKLMKCYIITLIKKQPV